MQRVLHEIERAALSALDKAGTGGMDEPDLAAAAGLSADQARRGIEWLRHKGLAGVSESSEEIVSLGPAGLAAASASGGEKGGGGNGLPERRLLELLAGAGGGPAAAGGLQAAMGPDFGPAMGIARRAGWAKTGPGGTVELAAGRDAADRAVAVCEGLLVRLKRAGAAGTPAAGLAAGPGESEALAALKRRPGYIVERSSRSRTVRLTASGMLEAARLEWRGGGTAAKAAGAIDVEAAVPAALPARLHPLTETIELVRDAFVALGFTEIEGPHVQPGFWNFDALFTPQDHPAREMQDTFYVAGPRGGGGNKGAAYGRAPAPKEHARAVSDTHRRGWGHRWSEPESRRAVLRTHTTCVTVRHLAENRPRRARVFSLGRVFRNEKPSYKHLAEFHQVEGVVAGPEASMRSLMGMLEKFYSMIGVQRVRFWPTFFPYTEPSLQAMAYSERHGKWVELFGMGMLRREVTGPLGMGNAPVLAWGGGIERIAMMRYGVDDVRRFYGSDLGWLRGSEAGAAACP